MVCVDYGGGFEVSADEEATIERAKDTAQRWGRPVFEPVEGLCRDCSWFVRLDGDICLLDYGVCTSIASSLDGRIVNVDSGCSTFQQGNP
jgi:hypothetical protein